MLKVPQLPTKLPSETELGKPIPQRFSTPNTANFRFSIATAIKTASENSARRAKLRNQYMVISLPLKGDSWRRLPKTRKFPAKRPTHDNAFHRRKNDSVSTVQQIKCICRPPANLLPRWVFIRIRTVISFQFCQSRRHKRRSNSNSRIVDQHIRWDRFRKNCWFTSSLH